MDKTTCWTVLLVSGMCAVVLTGCNGKKPAPSTSTPPVTTAPPSPGTPVSPVISSLIEGIVTQTPPQVTGSSTTINLGKQPSWRWELMNNNGRYEAHAEGFVLRSPPDWAMAGMDFGSTFGREINCSNGCLYHFKVQGLQGFTKFQIIDWDQGTVSSGYRMNRATVILPDANTHDYWVMLPPSPEPLKGIGIYFSHIDNYQTWPNPVGSGLLIKECTLTEFATRQNFSARSGSGTDLTNSVDQTTYSGTTVTSEPVVMPGSSGDSVIGAAPPSDYRSIYSAAERRQFNLQDLGVPVTDLHDIEVIPNRPTE